MLQYKQVYYVHINPVSHAGSHIHAAMRVNQIRDYHDFNFALVASYITKFHMANVHVHNMVMFYSIILITTAKYENIYVIRYVASYT